MLCYVILYSFDKSIGFVKNNLGWFVISVLFVYCIVLTKLIICIMAKMEYLPVHFEYCVFLIYFYFQYTYDGTAESEAKLRYGFYTTFAVLLLLHWRLFQS